MSILTKIFDQKAKEIEAAKSILPLSELKAAVADCDPTLGFRRALMGKADLALIAEVKKASPSKGVIRPDFDASKIASVYEKAGANALSVLTDEKYFQGSPENLRRARAASRLPILRKDFVKDPYQVFQSRVWGADAILLIVAALQKSEIRDLYGLAKELSLDVLVEVHTAEEVEIANELKCDLVGVNNRNLADFHTDIAMSEVLLPQIEALVKVSESALETRGDLDRVKAAGAQAVLIGTTFCAAPDIFAKVREVMGT